MKKITRYPWMNAVLASSYIVGLVSLLNWATGSFAQEKESSLMMPMIMISIFTLSAAVMGYLFLSQPLMMYLDGKKKEAVSFFLKTVGVFAGITVIFLVVMLFVR